ncbi:rhomboid-like protein [Kitasatospora sp. NBC_01539]|uniref:rhomboid-like protein n=1 Tax=Kitasatospora sp. NBC_01539 TaxID=2903577 RepID=UPI00386013A6
MAGAGHPADPRGPHPAVRLRDAVPTPRRTPFTVAYLALLLGTTLLARFADPVRVHRLQALSSTDVHNLLHHPAPALLASGLWVAGPIWTPYLWAFALTVAPLERRVGAGPTAAVFAAGHVGATLLSQGVVLASVAAGRLSPDLLDALDIGVSYGVLACLGALAGLLRPRARAAVLAAAAVYVGQSSLLGADPVTVTGHPAALLVGIALWRPLRRRARPGPPRTAGRPALPSRA